MTSLIHGMEFLATLSIAEEAFRSCRRTIVSIGRLNVPKYSIFSTSAIMY